MLFLPQGTNHKEYYDIDAAETASGIEAYAKELEKTSEELMVMLDGKKILDLGSGSGLLALECAIRRRILPNAPVPAKVTSVNVRYAASDYNSILKESNADVVEVDVGGKTFTVNLIDNEANSDPLSRAAVEEYRQSKLGLDWNQLNALAPNSYDYIISVRAFPFYSDLQLKDSLGEPPYPEGLGSYIDFGPESQKVIKELARILSSGGEAYLVSRFAYWAWEKSPQFQRQFIDFCNKLGCDLQVPEPKAETRDCCFVITKR